MFKWRPVKTVLVEFGFADSPKDDIALLRDNWERLAEAVVKSVCEFLGYKYTIASPIGKYTVVKGDTLYSIAKKFNMSSLNSSKIQSMFKFPPVSYILKIFIHSLTD